VKKKLKAREASVCWMSGGSTLGGSRAGAERETRLFLASAPKTNCVLTKWDTRGRYSRSA
jgi:hypothetical protein